MALDKRIEFRIGHSFGRRRRGERRRSDGRWRHYRRAAGGDRPRLARSACSEDAYRQVSGRLDMAVSDLGQTEAQEHRKVDPGLFAASGRPRPSETFRDGGQTRRAEKYSRRTPLAAGIVALIVIATGALVLPRRATAPRKLRIFPSLCCPSPTSPAIRLKTISPTGSPKISPLNSRAFATVSSSPATPRSPLRARAWTSRKSARSLAFKLCARRLGATRRNPRARQCPAPG